MDKSEIKILFYAFLIIIIQNLILSYYFGFFGLNIFNQQLLITCAIGSLVSVILIKIMEMKS